jgi:hypothetical protein
MTENENNLAGILNKVKMATQQVADVTVRQAKIARLRFDIMTLHSERAKHLQSIGNHLFSLYKQEDKFTQTQLYSQLQPDLDLIESVDSRIEAIEAQLQVHQNDSIEIKDITPK